MKRAILVFTVFAFTLSLVSSLFSSSAFAQSPTSSDRQIRGGGITRTATSSSTSTTLSKLEQRNEKIRSFALQMQQRLSVIVGNLEKTASRVETQINKQINKSASSTVTSVDFSASQAKLADAKKKIDELKTGIAGLGQKAEEIMVSKTPKTAFYTVREKLVKAFVAKIKVIHKELLDSVKLAKKEIVKTNAQNATSTQDVSDWKTYRNKEYGFEFRYPSDFSIENFKGINWILKLASPENKILLISLESDRFPEIDTFEKFALTMAEISCVADGPRGSAYCDNAYKKSSFTNSTGIVIYEIYLNETTEDYKTNQKITRSKGPVFALNFSPIKNQNIRGAFINLMEGTFSDKEVIDKVISTFKFIK